MWVPCCCYTMTLCPNQKNNRYYVDKYNLEGQILPHTAILDPRTGAQLLKVVGFVEPEDLSMALVEFLENNNIDQVKRSSYGNMLRCGWIEVFVTLWV